MSACASIAVALGARGFSSIFGSKRSGTPVVSFALLPFRLPGLLFPPFLLHLRVPCEPALASLLASASPTPYVLYPAWLAARHPPPTPCQPHPPEKGEGRERMEKDGAERASVAQVFAIKSVPRPQALEPVPARANAGLHHLARPDLCSDQSSSAGAAKRRGRQKCL